MDEIIIEHNTSLYTETLKGLTNQMYNLINMIDDAIIIHDENSIMLLEHDLYVLDDEIEFYKRNFHS